MTGLDVLVFLAEVGLFLAVVFGIVFAFSFMI